MAYIGTIPAEAYTSFAVQHFTTSATDTFTLDFPVANENEIALFINNVRQEPGSSYAYTASGTTLTLSSAITGSDSMYCVFIGKAVQTVTPASGSVTNDMLAGSIANAKLANSSITLNGSAVSLGGSATITQGITMADQWRVNTDFTGDNAPISSNWEQVDTGGQGTLGTAMSQSSGVFTFPETGIYLVTFQLTYFASNSSSRTDFSIQVTTNNSTYTDVALGQVNGTSGQNAYSSSFINTLIDVTDTSNVKVRFKNNNQDNSNTIQGNTNYNATGATFIRMGDT